MKKNKEDLLALIDKKVDELFNLYKETLINKKNDYVVLDKIERLIFEFKIKRKFFENLSLDEDEITMYYDDINSINFSTLF